MARRVPSSLANSNASLLDNPQPFCGLLGPQNTKSSYQNGKRVLNVLGWGPQDPDAPMLRRGIEPNIGEIQIKSNQNPIFLQTRIEDFVIRSTAELLVNDRMRVVTCLGKHLESDSRKVFVDLESHGRPL